MTKDLIKDILEMYSIENDHDQISLTLIKHVSATFGIPLQVSLKNKCSVVNVRICVNHP